MQIENNQNFLHDEAFSWLKTACWNYVKTALDLAFNNVFICALLPWPSLSYMKSLCSLYHHMLKTFSQRNYLS